MSDDLARRAAEWVERTYGGSVRVADSEPLMDGEWSQLFGCEYVGDSGDAPLAAAVVVPKNGADPFPAANSAPLDEEFNGQRTADLSREPWRWRVNARGCLISMDAAVDHRASSALPWSAQDEAPGWWDRLVDTHFPHAEVSRCESWAEVTSLLWEGGVGTRGVVWLRRQLSGIEITGHLLYGLHDGEHVVFLDGQRGTLAQLDDEEVAQLVVARFHRPLTQAGGQLDAPWEAAAPDLGAAVDKARSWLELAYRDPVLLIRPDEDDETERGWLFACTTRRFRETGDWRAQMLDAALVVPKAVGEAPFALPNSDPWGYLEAWNAGRPDLPTPPEPGAAAWFEPTMRELGGMVASTEHRNWAEVLGEIAGAPDGTRALVWVRRRDSRGRETVGNLLVAVNDGGEVRLIDSGAGGGRPDLNQGHLSLRVIQYRA